MHCFLFWVWPESYIGHVGWEKSQNLSARILDFRLIPPQLQGKSTWPRLASGSFPSSGCFDGSFKFLRRRHHHCRHCCGQSPPPSQPLSLQSFALASALVHNFCKFLVWGGNPKTVQVDLSNHSVQVRVESKKAKAPTWMIFTTSEIYGHDTSLRDKLWYQKCTHLDLLWLSKPFFTVGCLLHFYNCDNFALQSSRRIFRDFLPLPVLP